MLQHNNQRAGKGAFIGLALLLVLLLQVRVSFCRLLLLTHTVYSIAFISHLKKTWPLPITDDRCALRFCRVNSTIMILSSWMCAQPYTWSPAPIFVDRSAFVPKQHLFLYLVNRITYNMRLFHYCGKSRFGGRTDIPPVLWPCCAATTPDVCRRSVCVSRNPKKGGKTTFTFTFTLSHGMSADVVAQIPCGSNT